MPSEKIDIINNWTLQKVFTELENGNMKIPRFQRGYSRRFRDRNII